MTINLNEDHLIAIETYEQWTELRNSEASTTYEVLYSSIFMSHVSERNYQQLTTTLRQFESIDIIQKHLTGEKIQKDEFILVTGLFTNYIASAIALRDSTRNICKDEKFFPKGLRGQAASKLQSEIILNSNVKVIEDIRNIITHQSLIVPVLSFVARDGKFESGYSYTIKQLLTYERLTKPTREHLLKITHGNLYLRPLIEQYHHATANYQNWLINEALKKHKNDNQSYWQVRNKVSAEWGGDLEPASPLPKS
ncbi:hypothetical protein SJ753_14685 [Enterobacter kobei]|uniref:hypothetical protein n=1 Tax=Enterobacter kobei TaxID=208224 RepID=UPI0029DCC374|nr:hypothetical protein [Enterobacter kobei]MDX7587738.1 hypothetical protein [Enterobacter kobei]